VNGAFFQAGQRCTASSRIIVTEGIHDRFVDAMVERIKKLVIDDALKPGIRYRPVRGWQAAREEPELRRDREERRRKLVVGGERLKRDTDGFYMAPALFTEPRRDMRINKEEVFGPVASVTRVKNYDEALATANATPFGCRPASPPRP
jgi:aldehyde dehydrogenase (NAD+)